MIWVITDKERLTDFTSGVAMVVSDLDDIAEIHFIHEIFTPPDNHIAQIWVGDIWPSRPPFKWYFAVHNQRR